MVCGKGMKKDLTTEGRKIEKKFLQFKTSPNSRDNGQKEGRRGADGGRGGKTGGKEFFLRPVEWGGRQLGRWKIESRI